MEHRRHQIETPAPPWRSRLSALSSTDVERLNHFKWRYLLEGYGFTAAQANRLLFTRWLYLRRVLRD